MSIDDAYTIERVLAQNKSGRTELVTIDGTGPFIRKRIFHEFAHRSVWAALSECKCVRLPHVEASYEMPDTFVVVCSYVPGQTLTEYLAGGRALSTEEAVKIVENVCEAVAELHRHGIVHCDITPENVIIAADGAHIIDLGIACMEHEGASRESANLGTWGFAAPEQYGFAKVDKRSDVYSIGRLLGYLLTGVRPDSDRFEEAMKSLEQGDAGLHGVVARASSFEPSKRYQSVEALADDMRQAVSADLAAACVTDTAGRSRFQPNASEAPASPDPFFTAVPNGTPYDFQFGAEEGESYWQNLPQPEQTGKPQGKRKKGCLVPVIIACICAGCIGGGLLLHDLLGPGSDGTSGSSGEAVSSADSGDSQSSLPSFLPDASSSGDTSSSAPSSESVPFSIVESGWSVDRSGYVHYSIALHNDSDSLAAICPEVVITGRDKSGKVVFSDSQVLSSVSPDATICYSGQAGNGTAPATVEFTPAGSLSQVWSSELSSDELYTVEDSSFVKGSYGADSFVGEVKTNKGAQEAAFGSPDFSQICLSVVLRNEKGEMIGGSSTFVAPAAEGSSTTFEILSYDTPDFDSYEIYAITW